MLADIRYAVRQLLRSPGFTVVAVFTLALGIGVNTTTFTILNTLLFNPPPFGNPSRLVYAYTTSPQSQYWSWSPAEIRDTGTQKDVFERFASYGWWNPSMAKEGEPARRLAGMSVSQDFLPMLEVPPAMGRLFTAQEDRDGGAVVVSNSFWKRDLGGDPGVIGRVLRLDGKPSKVVGVMPPSFDDPLTWGHVDLWTPVAYSPQTWEIRDGAWLNAIGRLRDGVTIGQARTKMDAFAARLAHDFPGTNAGRGLNVAFVDERRIDPTGQRISWLTMDLTLFVLLIACVNLASLQLARTTGQRHEHAIRLALGSSRWRLVRQLLTETMVVSLAGGAAGVLVATWGNSLLGGRISISGTEGYALPLDLRVIAFTVAASAATGAIFGILPAWMASRTDANTALKQGGRGKSSDRSRHRLRHGLVVAEIAIALMLLAGAGFFVRGIRMMAQRDFGWATEHRLVGRIDLADKYDGGSRAGMFYEKLRTELGAVPGVEKVSVSGGHPANGWGSLGDFAVEGRPIPPAGKEPIVFSEQVSPDFFASLGIRVLQGREFGDGDRPTTRKVAVIGESMARNIWPGENPIGKRIGTGARERRDWLEVVGVVNDISLPFDLFQKPETRFQMYTPIYQGETRWVSFTVKSGSDPRALKDTVRHVIARIDPDVAVFDLRTAREWIDVFMANFSLVSWVLGVMALLGLLLSSVGIYGVIANLAAERTQEIGIRTALGAQRRDVLWLVMRNGLRLAATGSAVGLGLAFMLTSALGKFMPEIPGQSAVLTIGVGLLILVVALVACWLPALRATRVDPVVALRAD
jgi:putative ABC transport system permease protein